jgi:UDP-glucose 4-epimerase
VQTSLYGASKLAGEGVISAYCTGYGFSGWVFRFVSILGERYTHGHVFDFVRQLRADPARLDILGDGKQRKSYLYVQDCVDAMLLAPEKLPHGYHVLNLGTDEYISVNDSVSVIIGVMGVRPHLCYRGGERGWVGDSPFIFLDCARMRALGWRPRLSIAAGIEKTTKYLLLNPSLLDGRS